MEFVSVIEKKNWFFFGFLGFKFSLHHIILYLAKSYTTYFKPRR